MYDIMGMVWVWYGYGKGMVWLADTDKLRLPTLPLPALMTTQHALQQYDMIINKQTNTCIQTNRGLGTFELYHMMMFALIWCVLFVCLLDIFNCPDSSIPRSEKFDFLKSI